MNKQQLNIFPSLKSSRELAKEIMDQIEKMHPIKTYWEEITALRFKKLGRKGESYFAFRLSMIKGLTETIEAERNGWIRMQDGPPPVGEHVQLWLTDNETIVMQAKLLDKNHTVMQVIAGGEIEFKNISNWKLLTVPQSVFVSGKVVDPENISVVVDN